MRANGQIQSGFTLVEMIMVIVITGILGSMAAVFIKMPVQQYVDVARRAELTDIMDLALGRMENDIRSALPHSARASSVACTGGTCSFLEILPSSGSGRYRNGAGGTGDALTIAASDASFEVLGAMPTFASGVQVIVTDNTVAAAYNADYRTSWVSTSAPIVTITPLPSGFPSPSPSVRFHIIDQAVSYVCDPAGTLTRYSYPISTIQPTATTGLGAARLLANNVNSCSFGVTDNNGAVGNSLVAISLGLSKDGETAMLYKVVHVGSEP